MQTDEHWSALKAALLDEGGYDRLVDFLGDALTFALIERATAQTQERMRVANIKAVISNDAAQ